MRGQECPTMQAALREVRRLPSPGEVAGKRRAVSSSGENVTPSSRGNNAPQAKTSAQVTSSLLITS